MKVIDIIFGLVCGRVIGFLIGDFLKGWGIELGFYYSLLLWVVLPFFTLFCLWIASLVGQKVVALYQMAKFVLVGAFATVVDLKLFEFLLAFFLPLSNVVFKGVSFLIATIIKFYGNKYWAFGKHEKEHFNEEAIRFFFITIVGLIIDITVFYYATKVLGSQFMLSEAIWLKISVILAAIVAAVWNFLGYKFLVFKK